LKYPSEKELVLSVRPRFADAIVDGLKTVEIRRRKPNVQPGSIGFVYSSSPIQALVGIFRVGKIFSGNLDDLWKIARDGACISKLDFDEYFDGVAIGHAMAVSCAQRFRYPIKLSQIRVLWPEHVPPRSFGYIVAADVRARRMIATIKHRLFKEPDSKQLRYSDSATSDIAVIKSRPLLLKSDQIRTLLSVIKSDGRSTG